MFTRTTACFRRAAGVARSLAIKTLLRDHGTKEQGAGEKELFDQAGNKALAEAEKMASEAVVPTLAWALLQVEQPLRLHAVLAYLQSTLPASEPFVEHGETSRTHHDASPGGIVASSH